MGGGKGGCGHGSGTSRQLSPDEILHGPWEEESSGYRCTFTGGKLVLLHLLMTVYLQRTLFQGFLPRLFGICW